MHLKRATINVNGINLFYRDTETAGRLTLFCLHGMYGRGETWSAFFHRYAAQYRVIAPDQRGHGFSDKPITRYAADDLAADAYGLIQQLGCGPVILVGHSMGGRVAGHLAACYPDAVKALVIMDKGVSGRETMSTLPPEEIVPLSGAFTDDTPTPYPTYEAALQDINRNLTRPSNKRYFLESLIETADGYDYLFSLYAMAAIREYECRWDHLLPQIQCPTLLVRATESECLTEDDAQRMRELIKDLTYYEVSNSDHMVHADNPDEFYPPFEQFLERVRGV